jgi:DNA polymerase-3 subunit alpha
MLAGEKELLGFYISGHPLTQHAWALETYGLADMEALEAMPNRTMTRVGGLACQVQKRFTKRTQEPMATFRLERTDGALAAVAFPDCFREYGVHLWEDAPVMLCGEVSRDDVLKIKVNEIYLLEEVHRHFTERVGIHVPAATLQDAKLEALRDVLRRYPGDIPVVICLQFPGGEKVFVDTDRNFKVTADPKLVHELEHLLGEDSVYVGATRQPCKRNHNARNGRNGRNRNHRRREATATA